MVEPLNDLTESMVGMVGGVNISGDPSILESRACFYYDVSKKNDATIKILNDSACPSANELIYDSEPSTSNKSKEQSPKIVLYKSTTDSIQNEKHKLNCIPLLEKNVHKQESKKQRLEETVTAVNILGEASNDRNEMLKSYYKDKLDCLRELAKLKERSTVAKERMCVAQEKIFNALINLSGM